MAIQVQLSNQSFTLHFLEEKNERFLDDLENWSSFQIDALSKVLENRIAVFYVYTPDGDFEFSETSAKTWSKKQGGKTYFLAASEKWSANDVGPLVSTMQFELGAMWIQLFTERYDESKIDPVEFFESADKVLLGGKGDANIECIGNVADGREIVWENPKWHDAERFLPELKTICERFNLKWLITDKRGM